MIKNLSQFKKALTVGSKWRCFNLSGSEPQCVGVRPVAIKQTNSVAFETARGNSWLEFQPARFYTFEGGRVQVYSESGRVGDTELYITLEYELVE